MLHTKNYDPIAHHAELDQQRGKAEYQHECDREWQRSLEKNYKPKILVPDMKVIPTIVIYCAESHGYYQFDSQSDLLYERALDKAIQEQWTLKRLVQILESGHRYPLAKSMVKEHKAAQEGGRKYDWLVRFENGTEKTVTYRGALETLWRRKVYVKSISPVEEYDYEDQKSFEKTYVQKKPIPNMEVIPSIAIYCAESYGYYQFSTQSELLYKRVIDKAIKEKWMLKHLIESLKSEHKYPLAKAIIREHRAVQEGGWRYTWVVRFKDGTQKAVTYREASEALQRQKIHIKSISPIKESLCKS